MTNDEEQSARNKMRHEAFEIVKRHEWARGLQDSLSFS
jgi:hypothetical protein